MILTGQKEYLEALLSYNKALEIERGNVDYFIARADLFQTMKNDESAVHDYGMALDLNPKNAPVWLSRGKSKVALGKIPEACSDFKQAKLLGMPNGLLYYNKYCTQ